MKKPTVLRLSVVLCTLVVLSACQKETSQTKEPVSNETNDEYTGLKMGGVIPDDPAKIARVPTIMSQDFLSNTQKYMTSPDMLSARGKPVKPGTDVTPPSVSISSPANGSTVSGAVSIQVTATDNAGVKSVSLKVDGTAIGTSSTSPYTFKWTATSGSHTIVATAIDAAGNSASNSITVSQNVVTSDITAPSVSITSPASGSTVSGTVNVAVSASDNTGIKSVSLSVDGTVISTLTAAPYNFSWNASVASDGNHSISAKATDAAGNSNTATITVAKNTTITTLPAETLPSSVSLNMPSVGNQGSEGCCVSFAVGYAARSCEQYYKTGASTFSLSSNIFSPEFLYNQTKFDASCTSGSSLLTALDFLKYIGICTWQTMPYTSGNGCSLLPTSAQNTEASKYKISSYSSIYTTDITAIKTMLASNHPLMITFSTDQNFYNAGPGFIWKSYSSTSGPSHAVAICGYDDAKHAVKIINSWGTSWGENGYSWIDYSFLPQLNPNVYIMKL